MNKLSKAFKHHFKYFKKQAKAMTFLKASRLFFYAFIFMLPFQIDVIIYASPLFESGNFNYITSFFVYFGDFLFLLAFICWAISMFTHEYKEKITYGNSLVAVLLIAFFVFVEVSALFARDQWLSFLYVVRFFQLLLMYFYVMNRVVKLDIIINVFIASVSVQAFIAISQYLNQGAIGLGFLGEPNIAADTQGIAKMEVDGSVLIRSYGTLPHPNILSGYLLVAMMLSFMRIKQKEHIAYPLLFLQVAAFVLTFSRGAFLALFVAFIVYISLKESRFSWKYLILIVVLLSFFVVVFNLEQTLFSRILFENAGSLDERVFYFGISKQMMFAIPFGVGIGNFTLNMPDFTGLKLAPWDFQPVHNIYMLVANEMGMAAAVLFMLLFIVLAILLFVRMKKSLCPEKLVGAIFISILAGIFVIGLFDHYLISLYHGQVLLFLLFAIFGMYLLKKETH